MRSLEAQRGKKLIPYSLLLLAGALALRDTATARGQEAVKPYTNSIGMELRRS